MKGRPADQLAVVVLGSVVVWPFLGCGGRGGGETSLSLAVYHAHLQATGWQPDKSVGISSKDKQKRVFRGGYTEPVLLDVARGSSCVLPRTRPRSVMSAFAARRS